MSRADSQRMRWLFPSHTMSVAADKLASGSRGNKNYPTTGHYCSGKMTPEEFTRPGGKNNAYNR